MFHSRLVHRGRRWGVVAGTALIVAGSTFGAGSARASGSVTSGVAPGTIKHVWNIILENKSYDASFTGLNNNTYLWNTLPAQGVLLKNYYGTGHFSQDNYMALVSGQAPQVDHQQDCATYEDMRVSTIDAAGEAESAAGPNAAGRTDTASWSTSSSTITDATITAADAGKLVTGVGVSSAAGVPSNPTGIPANATVGAVSAGSFTLLVNGSPATPSAASTASLKKLIIGANGCVYPSSVSTLFNQFDAAGVSWKGYAQDLQNTPGRDDGPCGAPSANPTTTPVPNPGGANADGSDQYVSKHFPFPWFHSLIDNATDCDSAHIANLTSAANGLYIDLQKPADQVPAFNWITPNNCSDAHDAICKGNNLSGGWADPNTPNAPVNYTGGLYASDLFLEHYIPMIEASAAFQDHGLIIINFDEAFPAFTFTGNSFNNSATELPNASASIQSDTAGENINGVNVASEPQGPNTPLATDANGNQLFPGAGYNAFIHRDTSIPGLILGGGSPAGVAAATHAAATGTTASATITDPSVVITDQGRTVTGTNIPADCVVANVSNTGPLFPTTPSGAVVASSFTLNCNGVATNPTGPVSGVTFGALDKAHDPLADDKHPTNGGGQTGAIMISPYITPGTTTEVNYDHYSWLRSMEDMFGIHTGGVDGYGHLGYAATPGLASFGTDVFNNPAGNTPPANVPETPLPVLLGISALLIVGGHSVVSRRRDRRAALNA